MLSGAASLLERHTELVCSHVADVLPVAISLAADSPERFGAISEILLTDITGMRALRLAIFLASFLLFIGFC